MTDLVSARLRKHFVAVGVETDSTPRGAREPPPAGNIVYAAVKSSGVTRPVPSASDGTSGRSRSPASDARRRTRLRRHALLEIRGRGVVRFEERGAQRQRVSSSSPAFRGFHSGSPGAGTFARPESTDTGE